MSDIEIRDKITGLILAGGQARRMGGTDKGLIQLAGRSMIDYVIDSLRPQVSTILINANRNHNAYKQYGYVVIEDNIDDFQGPLAGMACGLEKATTDYIATVPCDGPFLPNNYVETLFHSIDHKSSKISVAYDGNRLQPVYALIHRDLLPDLIGYLASGERKIDRWYDKHHFEQADFSSQREMFTNINTPEDLQKATDLLKL